MFESQTQPETPQCQLLRQALPVQSEPEVLKEEVLVIPSKISSTALIAIAAAFAFTNLGPANAQERRQHWFYNDYDRYDEEAYDDDDAYDREYPVYAPSWRELKRLKWLKRQKRQRRQARRQHNQDTRYLEQRPKRQRLYDAWQGNQPQLIQPRRAPATTFSAPAPQFQQPEQPFRLSYVPLPRRKPYHLIPQHAATPDQSVKTTSLDGRSQSTRFDQRPNWNPAPAITSKKAVEITELPKITPRQATTKKKPSLNRTGPKKVRATETKPQTKPAFKPIRIEVAKSPNRANDTGSKKFRPKQRLAANQLSCDKAKTIVSGFGFSDITAHTCTGSIYDFNAKRDGNPYSVRLSSLSGELKSVKKIK